MLQDATLIGYALLGTLIGSLVGLVPGLHVFNIAGAALLLYTRDALLISNTALAFVMLGLVIGWSVVNVIPSIFLFAPDDAGAFMVLPATKMLLRGQGAEAALLVGAGTVAGLLALVALSPFLEDALRPIRAIIQPHIGWMLVTIIAFLVLGEWPRTDNRAPTPLGRLAAAWAYLGAALLTFTLSGLMGFVLMYRSPVPLESSYQNLLPAFVGLFTIPGLLQVFAFGQPIPPQAQPATQTTLQTLTPYQLLRGTLTGISGGLFASVLPVVSGGIGGLLAGHATSRYDDRLFLISQGASKVAYYIGSTLLLFVPGVGLVRGGLSWMLSSLYVPYGPRLYALVIAAIGLCGAASLVVLMGCVQMATRAVSRINPKPMAVAAMCIAAAIAFGFTGINGLLVMGVATCIGCIPVFVGGRRMNCLGIILLPITLNVVGVGADVARWLGLL
jgi:putative membrane protein